MFKHIETLALWAIAAAMYSCCASAAIFETQHFAAAIKPVTDLHALRGSTAGRYQAASMDQAGALQLPSVEIRIAKTEDFLWVALGEATLSGLQLPPPGADAEPHSVETTSRLNRKSAQAGAVRASEQGTAPETWAVILIGAGLIWSQLRRKTRHGAIRFTAP